MKNLFIILINLFFLSCNPSIEEKPVLPTCTCKDSNVIKRFIDQEGELSFPDTVNSKYTLSKIKGEISIYVNTPDLLIVCFDSLFLNQVNNKQIKNHSIVKFSGELLGGSLVNPCKVKPVVEKEVYDINITLIDPK
jgi:hypothetical protein